MKRVYSVLGLIGVILASVIVLLAFSGKAQAAQNLKTWYPVGARGVDTSSISYTRFVAVENSDGKKVPLFKDKSTGTLYETSASADEVYSGTGGRLITRGWLWFWPQGKKLEKNSADHCYGALVLHIDGGGGQINAYLVGPESNPSYGTSGKQCLVKDTDGTSGYGDDPSNSVEYQISGTTKQIAKTTASDEMATFKTFLSPARWFDGDTIKILGGNAQKRVKKDSDLYDELLKYSKQADTGAGNLTFYASDASKCLKNGRPTAWVGVDRSSVSARSQMHIFYTSGGGNDSGEDDWTRTNGGELSDCIFQRNVDNPYQNHLPVVYQRSNGSTKYYVEPAFLPILYTENSKSKTEVNQDVEDQRLQFLREKATKIREVLALDDNIVLVCWKGSFGRNVKMQQYAGSSKLITVDARNYDFQNYGAMRSTYADLIAGVTTSSGTRVLATIDCIKQAFGDRKDADGDSIPSILGVAFVPSTPDGTDVGGVSDSSSGQQEDDGCKIQGVIGWILTPICDGALKATAAASEVITDSLVVVPITQKDSATGDASGAYLAWQAMRNVANIFLVLVFMVVIFAQILPIEIDSYMIKKTLPKLIVAAILIQASFFICQIGVDISNVLGSGVAQLFDKIPRPDSLSSAGNTVGALNLGLTAAIGGVVLWAFAGPAILLALAALLAILATLLTIQVRSVIIVFLVIVSPLALLAWVLPNTESYFKKWGDNFIKLILMYPLIQGILSGSVLMMGLLQGSVHGSIQQIMVSFLPVIALFMIPATFKASGSLMGTIGGAVAAKGYGASKGLSSKARASLKEKNQERGATLMGSDSRSKRALGRLRTGNVFGGDKTKRNIRSAINKNYGEISEGIKDQYQDMSNSEKYEKFLELQKSGKAKDQLKATALGDMIAANGGGPEMAKYFDKLEMGDDPDHPNESKEFTDKDGKQAFRRGSVVRNADGSVKRVEDKTWSEIQKRNGAFLAGAVPHSISKPVSAAGASALIGNKSRGAARQLKEEVAKLRETANGPRTTEKEIEVANEAQAKIQRLANQFISASQREDASDMQPAMVKAFKELAGTGVFDNIKAGVKGYDGDVKGFIDRQTTNGNALVRFVQG